MRPQHEVRQDRCRSEHGDVINGYNEGADVFTANISDPRGRGICNNTGNIPSSPNVTLHDFETEAGMLTGDGRGQFVKAFEWVIRDFQVEGWEIQTVRTDDAVIGKVRRSFTLGGGSSRSFMPSSKRAWVAVLTVELPRSSNT
ncbi:hypothetical protein MHU86_12546 [Fragilaria crotonensis]|nr:hypothetical protein MHU86_12546 [Fragilaria crotonensis]